MTDPAGNVIPFSVDQQLDVMAREAAMAGLRCGGGGSSGELAQKGAVFEADVKEIKADLKTLIKDVAELKGKVSQLPTTLQMLGFVVAIVVAAGLVKHFFP